MRRRPSPRRCGVIAIAVALAAAGMVSAAADEQAVSVRVTQHVNHQPATIRLVIRLLADEANRALNVEVESLSIFRSSVIALDGESAPLVHWVRFARLPAGEYTVSVALRRAGAADAVAQTTFVVVE